MPRHHPWEFAITDKDLSEKNLVGVVRITHRMGYRLGWSYRGKGCMTDPASALLDTSSAKAWAAVVSRAFRDNAGSQQVLAITGFRQTGSSRLYCNARGAHEDHIDMVLTRPARQARSARLDAAAMERD